MNQYLKLHSKHTEGISPITNKCYPRTFGVSVAGDQGQISS